MGHKRVILKESEDIDVATLQQIEKFEQINKTTLPVKGPKRKKTVRVAPRTTVTEYNPQAEIDTLRAQNKVQKDILDKIDDVVLQSFYNYEPVQTYCEKKGSIEIDQILKIVHIMYEKRGENLQKAADANTDLQKKLTTAQANEANARGKLGMEKEKNKDHGSMKKAVTEKAAEVISLASQLKTANETVLVKDNALEVYDKREKQWKDYQKSVEAEKAGLQKQIAQKEETIQGQIDVNLENKRINNDLQNKLTQARKSKDIEVNELTTRLRDWEKYRPLIEKDHPELKKAYAQLEEHLKKAQEDLKAKEKAYQTEITKRENNLTEKEKELDEKNKYILKSEEWKEQTVSEFEKVKKDYKKLKEELMNTQGNLEGATELIKEKQKALDLQRNANSELQKEFEAHKEQTAEDLESKANKIERLEYNLDKFQEFDEEVEAYKEEVEKAFKEKTKDEIENILISRELSSKNKEFYNSQIKQFEEDITALSPEDSITNFSELFEDKPDSDFKYQFVFLSAHYADEFEKLNNQSKQDPALKDISSKSAELLHEFSQYIENICFAETENIYETAEDFKNNLGSFSLEFNKAYKDMTKEQADEVKSKMDAVVNGIYRLLPASKKTENPKESEQENL